ncbi:MAG: cyclic nucleotide-binding domain-containing protein [Deltaproteobacteria bacterium]|nr:cyclic nucleotide-binding domain-containing protein [Deltaproteobacteria bacterium]
MTTICNFFEESRIYQPGEIIVREGEKNRDLFILSEGVIEVSVKAEKEQIVINEIHPPEILGEISFLNGTPRIATLTARTRVEVYILSYEKVKQEMADIPAWFKLILRTLTARMKSCDQKIKHLETEMKKFKGRQV